MPRLKLKLKDTTHPKPKTPKPGYWRPTQMIAGKVVQYAWRCPVCRRVEYGNFSKPREIPVGTMLREMCPIADVLHGHGRDVHELKDQREI